MSTSPILKQGKNSEGEKWMEAMRDASALITGILRVTHPELFHTGCEVMKIIRRKSDLEELINQWGNPFNALSVIAHRSCPPHRDTKSRTPYYDILTSVGDFKTVDIAFTSLGATVPLHPGDVIAMCGHLVSHEAKECDGDRVCYAWYMRGSVHAHMEAFPASWMTQEVYKDFIKDPEAQLNRPFNIFKF